MGEADARAFFQKTFGAPPARLARAPGRLELLGNHTDYNGGLVMAVALEQHVWIAASPRKDAQAVLASSAYPGAETFWLDRLEKNPAAPWADYPKGLLRELQKAGVHFTGFNAAIHSTLPAGAGLASSAALLVASALIVRELFPYRLNAVSLDAVPLRADHSLPPLARVEKLRLARLAQSAEHAFAGVRCGLLDYLASLFGQEGHALVIDCLHESVEPVPLPSGAVLVVADSGVKHALSGGEYNVLRGLCESAAQKLGVKFLRNIDAAQLEKNCGKLTARELQCARHIVGENRRVAAGERALRAGDARQFGQFMSQSHASSRDDFQNSAPELDALAQIAQSLPGCLGARLTGGGFGGATLSLVERDHAPRFVEQLASAYFARTKIRTAPWVARTGGGAG